MQDRKEGCRQPGGPTSSYHPPAPRPGPSGPDRGARRRGTDPRHGLAASPLNLRLCLSVLGTISFPLVQLLSSGLAQRWLIYDSDFVNANLHPLPLSHPADFPAAPAPPRSSFHPGPAHWSLGPGNLGPGHLSQLLPGRRGASPRCSAQGPSQPNVWTRDQGPLPQHPHWQVPATGLAPYLRNHHPFSPGRTE